MLNDNLKKIRKEKNLTQDDVAKFLNVKRQTYGAYERGVSTPDAITLNKLANFFSVTTDHLLDTPLEDKILTNTQAAIMLKKELSKMGINIEEGKELKLILQFIDSNKKMLKELMKNTKE